jgi:hypothetical protein
MWFWPVNVMIERVLYLFFIFFLTLCTPNMSSRTQGWMPLIQTIRVVTKLGVRKVHMAVPRADSGRY